MARRKKIKITRRDYKGGKPSRSHNYEVINVNKWGNAIIYKGDKKGADYAFGSYSDNKFSSAVMNKKIRGRWIRIKKRGF